MAELISTNDSLNEGRKKLNKSIEQSERADNKAENAIKTSDEAKSIAQSAENKSDSVQEQFNQVVIDGDSSVEAAQARVDAKGQSHPTLKARLDDENENVTRQLARTASNAAGWINITKPPYSTPANGVDDDSAIINRAISENPNATIYFPDAEYVLNSTIIVPHEMKLWGESKAGTIFRIDGTTTNGIDLMDRVEFSGVTFKINNLLHSGSVIRYFAKKGGNKFGGVRDIDIIGLDGYQNTTKALELMNDTEGTNTSRSYVFFWTFENFNIEFCDTAWYTQADFGRMWSTACLFKNFVVERCKRAFYFNTAFIPGYFSKYDLIQWQFQCNDRMVRAFEGPADRSEIDLHIWDRSFFPNKPKSIYLKGNGRHNRFLIRNIDRTEVQLELPSSSIRNTFIFMDDPVSKTVMAGAILHINPQTGDDVNGDGSQGNPFKTLANVLRNLPKDLGDNSITLILAGGTYPESINLLNYTGGGTITIQGASGADVTLTGHINANSNRVKLVFRNLTATGNNGGIAVSVVDSEYTVMDGVSAKPTNAIGTGIYIQATRAMIRNGTINNSGTAIVATTASHVRVDSMNGSGNTVGIFSENASYVGNTIGLPSGFAATNYRKATASILVLSTGEML